MTPDEQEQFDAEYAVAVLQKMGVGEDGDLVPATYLFIRNRFAKVLTPEKSVNQFLFADIHRAGDLLVQQNVITRWKMGPESTNSYRIEVHTKELPKREWKQTFPLDLWASITLIIDSSTPWY